MYKIKTKKSKASLTEGTGGAWNIAPSQDSGMEPMHSWISNWPDFKFCHHLLLKWIWKDNKDTIRRVKVKLMPKQTIYCRFIQNHFMQYITFSLLAFLNLLDNGNKEVFTCLLVKWLKDCRCFYPDIAVYLLYNVSSSLEIRSHMQLIFNILRIGAKIFICIGP